MKSLTIGQVCAMLAIGVVSNKLLLLPSIMYQYAGQDALFVILFKFLLAILFVGLIMYVLVKNPDKNLREIVSSVIGDIGYRVLAFFIFIMYLVKCFTLLMESELFLSSTMYEEYNKILFIVPTIFIVGYLAYKGLRTVGRTCEALVKVIFIGLFITFLLSLSELDPSNILPLGTTPLSSMIDALNACFLWYGNYFILFFCLGDVKFSKGMVKKVYLTLIFSIMFVLAFFFLYYANFEYTSIFHKFAISDITQFTPEIASFTKVDWFTIIIWMITSVLQCAIQVYIMQRSFIEAFNIRKSQLFSFIFLAVYTLIYILLPFNSSEVINFVTRYASPYVLIVGIIIIALLLIATIRLKRLKKKESPNNV